MPDTLNSRLLRLAAAGFAVGLTQAAWADAPPDAPNPPAVSAASERIYAAAKPRLLQVRSVLASADRQSSLGSAFLVSSDGLAITNYHVVSQVALEPDTYRLEYTGADGRQGKLQLVAVDVANDLAVVKVDHPDPTFFGFDEAAISGSMPKGERLYAMGNPLDLGFMIVDGTYNGPVDRSYVARLHFSGAINPGMSGGPTVTDDGKVAGINVAKRLDGELVSFLVPARFAAALLAKVQGSAPPAPESFKAEIGRQIVAWQDGLLHTISEAGFRENAAGTYLAPESSAPWFTCWARTNGNEEPKPKASADSTSCATGNGLFVAQDLLTGMIYLSHTHLKSTDLNRFQFTSFVAGSGQPALPSGSNQRWHTHQQCREDFVRAGSDDRHPPLRITWCARAYRKFEGLYDVVVQATTQDRDDEALVSRLSLYGVSYPNALDLGRQFVESIQWTK